MKEMEQEFGGFMKSIGKVYGLPEITTQIIAVMYLEPEEIAMSDISRKTGYSLASISNAMKTLEGIGLVQRIKHPGSKKVFFYMEKDLARLHIQKFQAYYDAQVKPALALVPAMITKYKKIAKNDRSRKKIEILENYHRQAVSFEKVIHHWIRDLEQISKEQTRKW
jgi:HTH-type transcriptional regulator, osmoprotectant uptake regulator